MCDTQDEAKRLAFGNERHKVLPALMLGITIGWMRPPRIASSSSL